MKYGIGSIIILLIACEGDLIKSPAIPPATYFAVRYEITGDSGLVSIRMKNENGSTITFESEAVPWQYNFRVLMPRGSSVYLSAQNTGASDRTIRATIYKTGAVFKSSENSGPYTTVTVQGIL